MAITLGLNRQGEEVSHNFYEEGNLLISSGTGRGKTTLVRNIIDCAISSEPNHFRFIIADGKSVDEYASYADNPQVEIITILPDNEALKRILEFLENEIRYRRDVNACEDYTEYLSLIKNHDSRQIVFVIDGFTEIMREDCEFFEKYLRRINQYGGETGVFVIALTQCVNESIVTANILKMFPRRIFMGYGDIKSNKLACELLYGENAGDFIELKGSDMFLNRGNNIEHLTVIDGAHRIHGI